MLFRMELFSNPPKKRFFIYIGILILIIPVSYIFVIRNREKKSNQLDLAVKSKIEKLLYIADSCNGNEPEKAEKATIEALKLSETYNQTEYRIKSWLELGEIQKIKGHNKIALVYFLKAKYLSKEKKILNEYCEALLEIGELYYHNGDYDASLQFFQEAETLATDNKYDDLLSRAIYFIGKYYQTKGNFSKSKEYYTRALDICNRSNNIKQEAFIYPSLGKYYLSEGKLNLALECYLKAYNISEHFNDNLVKAEVCNYLGGLYLQTDQYQMALSFHKKALKYRKSIKNPDGLAKSYNNIGEVFYELKQSDSALIYFNYSLELCNSIDYKKGLVKSEVNIGKVYSLKKELKRSNYFLKQALYTSLKAGYESGIAESSLALGVNFQDENKFDSAIIYYQKCINKLSKTNYDEILRNAYQGLYSCFYFKKDFKIALEYHQLLLQSEKNLLNVENNRQLAILNITFNNELKEKDNQVLRESNKLKEIEIKRETTLMWLIIVLLGLAIILCLFIYNRFYIKKKANTLLAELNKKIIQQNNELKNLNKDLKIANQEKDKLFSIIAHELRNPLYWFQSLAETFSKNYQKMTPDKIRKTLSALDESAKNAFHLMDNLLNWSRSKLNRIHPKKASHHLQTLVNDTVQMYETIIQQKEINFINHITGDIEIYADADLFNCVIRNLVSNAIKYTPNRGTISIECFCSNDLVTIIVSDSGCGIPENETNNIFNTNNTISVPGLMQEKGSGLGLKLCKDFVEMNKGKIWVISKLTKGTQFFFTVPSSN
jgi:signal transduction histidine kinase